LNFHDTELLPGGREDHAHFPGADLPIDANILELDSDQTLGRILRGASVAALVLLFLMMVVEPSWSPIRPSSLTCGS
jgi:hypothetical protein